MLVRSVILLGILSVSRVAWGAGEAGESDAPVDIVGRVIFIQGTVNGQGPFKCILDTGATETVITPTVARQTKVTSHRVSPNQAKGSVQSIQAGGAGVSNLQVYVFDPPQALSLRLDKGMDYGVILGYTFLYRFVTTIDYAHKAVRFLPAGSAPKLARKAAPGEQRFIVPFEVSGGSILAKGTINGRGTATFLVDTGSAEVLITPKLGKSLGIKAAAEAGHPEVGFATVEQLAFGEATAANVPVIIHALPNEGQAAGRYDGIVGYPFLSNFKVTVNYRDKLLILEPPVAAPAPAAQGEVR